MKQLTIKTLFLIMVLVSAFLAVLLTVSIYWLGHASDQVALAERQRSLSKSYLLADMLRQSSDDLTPAGAHLCGDR